MKTRRHTQSIRLKASPEEIFAVLIAPSAVRKWWRAQRVIVQPEQGGIWIAAWGEDEDRPEYITSAAMTVFDPPKRIVMSNYRYTSRNGQLPFDADFSTEFLITPSGDRCTLQVTQDGFPTDPAADAFYAACETGWKTTLGNIAAYIERRHG